MSCWCDAAYERPSDCPRCAAAIDSFRDGAHLGAALDALTERDLDVFDTLFGLPEVDPPLPEAPDLTLPEAPDMTLPESMPDGPDEFLTLIAEMESALEQSRAELEADGGARRCRYCRGKIPVGTDAGVHEACLPAVLPEGARSCAGCGELILDDDDEFEHDFCVSPEETPEPRTLAELLEPLTEGDDAPTEPLVPAFGPDEAPVRARDSVRCTCGAWLPYEFVAPRGAAERGVLSAITLDCRCGTRISLCHSWARGCIVQVGYERRPSSLN